MTIASVNGIYKSYADKLILENITFKIEHNDVIGIIGNNGAGKTTLYRILCGEEEPDEGQIYYDKGLKKAFSSQKMTFDDNNSAFSELEKLFPDCLVLEQMLNEINDTVSKNPSEQNLLKQASIHEKFLSSGGLYFRERIKSTLVGLGLEDRLIYIPIKNLSGGQQTIVKLAQVVLSGADLLLLDEPTNHLDIIATQWLENYISSFKGAVVIISHDRYFLDKLCNKIMEIENHKLIAYNGNYSDFRAQKALNRLTLERDYNKKVREIKRIEGIIAQQRRFNQERNYVTIKSKQKQIDRIKSELVAPEKEEKGISFSFKACSGTGQDVLDIYDLKKSYGEKVVIDNLNMHIKAGEHVFIIGANGCGKTTLLKLISDKEPISEGTIKIGARVVIGYYDQNLSEIDEKKTVFEEIADSFPSKSNLDIRKALALFRFTGEDINKVCGELSGGEKARVSLVKLMMSEHNLLLLDEPTNHLDINSKEALEDALEDYDGTYIVVSHDRYFINKLATSLLFFNGGKIEKKVSNYDEYAQTIQTSIKEGNGEKEIKSKAYQDRKNKEAERRKHSAHIAKTEKEIESAEEELSELEALLQKSSDEGADYQQLLDISGQIEQKKLEIEKKYEEYNRLLEE